jgi:hypothetical protein
MGQTHRQARCSAHLTASDGMTSYFVFTLFYFFAGMLPALGYPYIYDSSSGLGIASVYWVLVDKLDEWQVTNKKKT